MPTPTPTRRSGSSRKRSIEAKRKSVKRRRVGFEQFLKRRVDRLGATPPDQWAHVDKELLLEVQGDPERRRSARSTPAHRVGRAHGEDVDE